MKTNEPRRIFTEAPLFPDFQFIYKKPITQNPINKQKKTTFPIREHPTWKFWSIFQILTVDYQYNSDCLKKNN